MTAVGCPKNANTTELAMEDNSLRVQEKYLAKICALQPTYSRKTNKQISQHFGHKEVTLLPFRQTVLAMYTKKTFNGCTVALTSNKNTHFLTKNCISTPRYKHS